MIKTKDKNKGCGIEKVKFEWKFKLSEGAKHNYSWGKNIPGGRTFQVEEIASELPVCLILLKIANRKSL